jgi:OmpA-OmpF porin, OOP family
MTTQKGASVALAAAVLGLLGWGTAAAEVEGFYFSVGGGLATLDLPSREEFDDALIPPLVDAFESIGGAVLDVRSELEDSDTAWGLQVGYRFHRYIAAEIGYVNLGEGSYEAIVTVTDGVDTFPVESSVRFVSSGPTAAVLGMLPISERFELHGKAGLLFADSRVRERVRDIEFDENLFHNEIDAGDQEVFVGIGGAWNFADSYAVRLEYQRFLDVGDDASGELDVDLISVSVLFR